MTKSEKILGIIIVISLILKINFIPYGGMLLLFSLTGLAFYYFQFGKAVFNDIGLINSLRKDSYAGVQKSLVIISKAAGIGLSLICIGILFKLNHWGYSYIILVFGLATTFLVSLIVFTSWRKSKIKTYTRILKRTVTIGLLGLIIAITPEFSIAKQKNGYQTEQINNSIFQYKLENKKLTDTLKVLDLNGNLFLFQDWKDGKLNKTFVVDEHGKTREMVFYSRQDSNSITQYYIDVNDQNYKTFPINEDMFDFYEEHCLLSSNSIFRDSINEVDIYNYPIKHLTLAVTNGIIKPGKDKFFIKTEKEYGDTMKVYIQHPLNGDLKKKFDLIIK